MSVSMDIWSGLVGIQPTLELARPKCSAACAEPDGDLRTRSRVAQTGPEVACDSTDAFAASAFAPTSHGIKSSMGADWRDHASAHQNFIAFALNISQLRDQSSSYSCPAFGGICRTRDDSKGRLVVFLVRIPKIYISGIRIRTNQQRSGIRTSMRVFSHFDMRVITLNFKIKFLRVLSRKKNAGRYAMARSILEYSIYRISIAAVVSSGNDQQYYKQGGQF